MNDRTLKVHNLLSHALLLSEHLFLLSEHLFERLQNNESLLEVCARQFKKRFHNLQSLTPVTCRKVITCQQIIVQRALSSNPTKNRTLMLLIEGSSYYHQHYTKSDYVDENTDEMTRTA